MEEDDKACPMIRMGVSVSSGTGLPRLSNGCVCVCINKKHLVSDYKAAL